ncbi:hypothetical protein [Nonomuraea rubra]|uniref:hypothetical protein n=1 Tax=Nonomuraea rubra TaxID=46180 RepID=UPI0031EBB785
MYALTPLRGGRGVEGGDVAAGVPDEGQAPKVYSPPTAMPYRPGFFARIVGPVSVSSAIDDGGSSFSSSKTSVR